MKTLEQIMEGVTAGGKWFLAAQSLGFMALLRPEDKTKWMPVSSTDAAYAARACSNFPALVQAIVGHLNAEDAIQAIKARDKLEAALAEALKD